MKRQVTLKQIAKELGVSIPTVSKALRDSKEISEETKQKVKAFAKLFNYRPNNIALSLKNRRTKTIGLIIPEIVHYFFSKVIRGVEIVANTKGYNVVVGLSSESFDKEVINMEMLANGSIDGFILSLSKETMLNQDYHHFIEAINQGMPVVMFDRVVNDIECDKVVIDDLEGSKRAVQKLIKNGAKKIVAITTKDYVSVGRLRTQGYIEAMEEHNMPLESNLILKLDDNILEPVYIHHYWNKLTQYYTKYNFYHMDLLQAVELRNSFRVLRRIHHPLEQTFRLDSRKKLAFLVYLQEKLLIKYPQQL